MQDLHKISIFLWLTVLSIKLEYILLTSTSRIFHFCYLSLFYSTSGHLLTSGFDLTEYIIVHTLQISRSPFWKECSQASQTVWLCPRYTLSITFLRRAFPVFMLVPLCKIMLNASRRKRAELIPNIDCCFY